MMHAAGCKMRWPRRLHQPAELLISTDILGLRDPVALLLLCRTAGLPDFAQRVEMSFSLRVLGLWIWPGPAH